MGSVLRATPLSFLRKQGSDVSESCNAPRYEPLSFTISIGYAGLNPETRLPEAVIKAADQALYRARQRP